jgi:peptidoglycan/LPS O-acetylase OafA/YrhL
MAGARGVALQAGNGGVDLFFVISGFIMVFTTGRKPVGPLSFFAARVRRIVPLYWSVTLAVFLLARLAPSLLQNTQADLRHLTASLLFTPMMRGDGTMRPVVFVGWTLNFEMAFYILFALGLLAPRRWMGVVGTVLVLAAIVVWGAVAPPQSEVLRFYATPMVLEFGLGMLLGLAWPRLRLPPWGVPLAIPAAAIAFALMLVGPALWGEADRLFVFGLPATVIVAAALAIERERRALSWRWLQVLGAASYAIYLSHFFVTQAVVLVARRIGLHGPAEALVAAGIAFAGVAAAGVALHYGLERGADRLIGRVLSDGRFRKRGSAPLSPKAKPVV